LHNDQHKEKVRKLCDHLGADYNDIDCEEVLNHVSKCPKCKVYVDTIKKTIILCKENDCLEEIPADVNKRLLKKLDLDNI